MRNLIPWAAAFGAILLLTSTNSLVSSQKKSPDTWASEFRVDAGDLAATGRNPYFILQPGYKLEFQDGKDKLVITVLSETRMVSGVETRVVEERETSDGKLVEVSRNYFAISKRTSDVYYFGEDVDIYKDGKVANHEGAWLAGVNGAKFGLAMPGNPVVKSKYYQEQAQGSAMDRAEIVSIRENVKTAAGTFKNCLKTRETTPLESGVSEYKYYAPGIGLVQDDTMKLISYSKGL